MAIILAFDPGEITGVAVVQWNEDEQVARVRHTFEKSVQDLYTYLWARTQELTEASTKTIVTFVIEQFRLYPWKGQAKSWSDLPEVRAQGAIEYAAFGCGAEIWHQAASSMKQLFGPNSDARGHIRAVGVTEHAQDALCHALLYLVRSRKLGRIPEIRWERKEDNEV